MSPGENDHLVLPAGGIEPPEELGVGRHCARSGKRARMVKPRAASKAGTLVPPESAALPLGVRFTFAHSPRRVEAKRIRRLLVRAGMVS